MTETSDHDWLIRRFIYESCASSGLPPTIDSITDATGFGSDDTQAALRRLAEGRVLVLQPETGEILMANPFSAVPTPFVVETDFFSSHGNCVWDALGISAMLKQDALITTACGDCGMALQLSVIDGEARGDDSVIHFAVPAHHWWDDIVFS